METNSMNYSQTPDEASEAWHRYAGNNDERYTIGPHRSRDDALTEAYGMGCERVFLVEASKVPVKLSSYFSAVALAEEVFEDADLNDPDSGHYVEISTTREQDKELEAAARAIIDEWQLRHKIVIEPWAFTATRNEETIEVELCPICDEPLKLDAHRKLEGGEA